MDAIYTIILGVVMGFYYLISALERDKISKEIKLLRTTLEENGWKIKKEEEEEEK
jgi:hypothetical protein